MNSTETDDTADAAREAALAALARREHGARELVRKLAAKGHAEEIADAVVRTLVTEGALSDERYAEAYVRQRGEKGYGPRRINQELRQRGVDDVTIEHALAASGLDWEARARRAREKKFRELPGDLGEKSRQVKFLEYRGFNNDQIRAALSELPV